MRPAKRMLRSLVFSYVIVAIPLAARASKPAKGTGKWTTAGYEQFAKGTFCNAGQNIYVSRAGTLQRIHQFDFNKDGYFDLIFCNSHEFGEKPPTYVYRNPLTNPIRYELPADGAMAGALADLNRDGYDDVVIGNKYNGVRSDLNAFIYYGSPAGLSEKHQQQLPAPLCDDVSIADFNGDNLPDIALLVDSKVRIFYQSELAFEPKNYKDLPITCEQSAGGDLDKDGFADLVIKKKDVPATVYWGSAEGITVDKKTTLAIRVDDTIKRSTEQIDESQSAEFLAHVSSQLQIVHFDSEPRIFVAETDCIKFFAVDKQRNFGEPFVLSCANPMAVDVGDINGDGAEDLFVVCQDHQDSTDSYRSWIYWGTKTGYRKSNRKAVLTPRACRAAVKDIDHDGYADIAMCQTRTEKSFSVDSFVFRGAAGGIKSEPIRLLSAEPREVLVGKTASDKELQVIYINARSRSVFDCQTAPLYSGGPGGFDPRACHHLPNFGAVEAICADLNDDSFCDLALANGPELKMLLDPGSYILYNGPDGFPKKPNLRLATNLASGVCCADLNRDGHLDLIFSNYAAQAVRKNPDLWIFYGNAKGYDTPEAVYLMQQDISWIFLADLNNDGWLDLVVNNLYYDRSLILWGDKEGSFSMNRSQILSVVRAVCAEAADLDGNGYLDLVIGGNKTDAGPHNSFVYVYWNGPDGLREDRRTLLKGNAVLSIAIADFNNDGTLDIFGTSYHGRTTRDIDAYIFWNRKGIGFKQADHARLFTHASSGSIAADFNEDGFIDLAIANHKVYGDHTAYSEVWWNGPKGFNPERTTRLPTAGPHGMTQVDPGNIASRSPEEYYISQPYKLPKDSRITSISWKGQIPAKTWVKAQVRFATTREDLLSAVWWGASGDNDWFGNAEPISQKQPTGRWVQYRLALGAKNSLSSPRISVVTVNYE